MAHLSRLSDGQRRALAHLSGLAGDVYLAGGTAVALHHDHRGSVDLDLFSVGPVLDLDALFADLPSAELVSRSEVTLRLQIEGVPVDVVRYPYPPIEAPLSVGIEVPIAGRRDLAAMKLLAISKRGLRRDFWDLAQNLDTGMTLDDALAAYRQRFQRAAGDVYPVLRVDVVTHPIARQAAIRRPSSRSLRGASVSNPTPRRRRCSGRPTARRTGRRSCSSRSRRACRGRPPPSAGA